MTGDTPTGPELAPPREVAPRRLPVAPQYRLLVFVLGSAAGVLGLRALMGLVAPRGVSLLGLEIPAFYITMAGGLWLGHWWTFRSVEPRGWQSIWMGRPQFRARAMLTGAALGAVAVGVPSGVLLLVGWLRVEPSPSGDWAAAALTSLIVLLPAALWEELMTRGYLFTVIRERVGARRAIVATSLVFGLLHIENAGATWQSVALVTLAGIFLGSILVATGSLYAAWSAHVAWNFVMAGVLHTTVSGIGMGAPNYRTVDAGPDWATGGSWGPEAGLLTGAGLLLGIYIMLRRKRRGAER
ncbi:MAG: lysostaphin resistance A-like protein [Gemmatimonadaceae bacterium]